MSVKTANVALIEAYSVPGGQHSDTRILPSGAYVKPIEWPYLPKHVKEDRENAWHDCQTHVFCYTRFGLVSIPRRLLMER